jgi:ATP-dependent Clp protease protease subunit
MKPIAINDHKFLASMTDADFKIYAAGESDLGYEFLIMDEIGEGPFGEGVSARDVSAFLDTNRGKDIHLRVNSPGGLAYDGIQIFNGLVNHDGKVTATVEGLAFSAASMIVMGADTVRMHEASDFGIHRSIGGVWGNQIEMAWVAKWLDKIDNHMAGMYQAKTGADLDQVFQWLDADGGNGTVFSAKEAIAAGFADEIIPHSQPEPEAKSPQFTESRRKLAAARARFDLARFDTMKKHRRI